MFLSLKDEILLVKSLYRDDDTSEELVSISFNDQNAWIKWDNTIYTKVNSIDNQHKYLIHLINKLYNTIKKDNSIITVLDALSDLLDYTDIHFRDEEKVMNSCNFPEIKKHIKEHHYFEKRLNDFAIELRKNPFIVVFDILDFLKGWLINHISTEDTKIKNYI